MARAVFPAGLLHSNERHTQRKKPRLINNQFATSAAARQHTEADVESARKKEFADSKDLAQSRSKQWNSSRCRAMNLIVP
jgi:hypothetical protein